MVLLLTSCSKGPADGAAVATPDGSRGGRAGDAAGAGGGGRGGRGGAGGPVPISATAVVQKAMPVNVRAVGNVEPSTTVDIHAQVTGALMSVGFGEGQDVTAGQLLFTLDSRPLDVAVKQAEATLARDTASLKGLQSQLVRQTDLFNRGLAAKSDFDALNTQVNALTATVQADAAVVENARLQVTYTKILAPVSGRTGALLVHEGSLVRANDTTPLVVINQLSPAYVSFAVPAQLLPKLTAGHGAALVVRAAPAGTTGQSSSGTVTFIDNAVDPQTDSVRVKATFQNKDRKLWPGAFVDVTLQLSVENGALVVPQSAVQPSQQGQIVYIVKQDQTVEVRPVKVARTDGNDVVIESGVTAGEMVVTDGQLRLTPGARVTIKPAAGAPRITP